MNLPDMCAVILAGGMGTRLRSVVTCKPKVIADVAGKPFITYLLEQLAPAGIRDVILSTGYLGEQISSLLGVNYKGLTLFYSKENVPLGTGGALRFASPLITSEFVIVMNGDSFCELDIKDFCFFHFKHNAEISIALTGMKHTGRYGRVKLDINQRITAFEEKSDLQEPGLINAGIYLISRNFLHSIPEGQVSLEKDLFPLWLKHGIYGYRTNGRFIDIGIPEDYMKSQEFFRTEM